MLTFRTLFSGGELFGCGAVAAGWCHVDGYEIEPSIAAVACLNGFDVRVADVCGIDYAALAPVAHLHASPSCRTASIANIGATETDEDRACAAAIVRAIDAHTAQGGRSFSLENVWAYRNYEGFARILTVLHQHSYAVDYRHVNAADYGVPQTRRRLILRAVRRSWRGQVPPLHPTHRRGGDMFSAPWVGWYAAIEDMVPTLPPSAPAPWQMRRMPRELLESFVIEGTGANDNRAIQIARADMPFWTVRAITRPFDTRAYLIDGDSGHPETGAPLIRTADEPAMTIRSSRVPSHRAVVGGRWVRLTLQALGRFQTVPDTYRGLTPEINGNGVPCLLAQRLMEGLR